MKEPLTLWHKLSKSNQDKMEELAEKYKYSIGATAEVLKKTYYVLDLTIGQCIDIWSALCLPAEEYSLVNLYKLFKKQ